MEFPEDGREEDASYRSRATVPRAVRFTNPAGPLFARFPARNHKKLVALDDRVAYLGGINFRDHNFPWHDLRLRIEDPDVVGFLREDFECSWNGRHRTARRAFPGIVLHSLDGASNEDASPPSWPSSAGPA